MSARVGSSRERWPTAGSSAGWRKKPRCWPFTETARDVMPSPSIRYRAHTWRCRRTYVFARLTRRPSSRSCGRSPGQVGTTNCGPGGCRSVRLTSYGADGRKSKRQLNMPNPKKGSGDERPPETLKLTRPPSSTTPNVAAVAIPCQPKIYRLWAAQLRRNNTALWFSAKCPVSWLSR